MELTRDVTAHPPPFRKDHCLLTDLISEVKARQRPEVTMSQEDLFGEVESLLQDKIGKGERKKYFHLGLLYMEQGYCTKAFQCFERSRDIDYQSLYEFSVMLYDGIGTDQDMHRAVKNMKVVAENTSRHAQHLVPAAMFNLGRAYFQGYGTEGRMPNDDKALSWWLMAADDGNPNASIKAQSTLGMFYSRKDYSLDLDKAFFWHNEACGNASLESQGALGVMYLHGLGVKKDIPAAYMCLKDASDRGNVFASANLVALLYQQKVYNMAADLAEKLCQMRDIPTLALSTDCLPNYIEKGLSMAHFYLARCLHRGLGTQQNIYRARRLYSKSFRLNADVCAKLHDQVWQQVL